MPGDGEPDDPGLTAGRPALRPLLVVLTGGRSLRMGTDKATLLVGGAPLAQRPVAALGPLCSGVVLSGRSVPGIEATTVADAVPGAGPLAAVAAVTAACPGRALLVVACDAPGVLPRLAALLIAASADHDAAACVRADGTLEPLPLALSSGGAERLAAAAATGIRSLRGGLGTVDLASVPEARWREVDPDGASLRSWNSPADLGLLPRLP